MTGIKFNPQKHHRRSIRLRGYDYSQPGAYFITIVTYQRECLFGEIVGGEMKLNQYGKIVDHAWHDLPNHYRHVEPGVLCSMPNHVHGVIILIDDSRGGSSEFILASSQKWQTRPYKTSEFTEASSKYWQTCPYKPYKRHALPEIVRAIKSFSAKRINALRNIHGISVWQRNYYEHIIRNDREMYNISRFVESNPSAWMNHDENPLKSM